MSTRDKEGAAAYRFTTQTVCLAGKSVCHFGLSAPVLTNHSCEYDVHTISSKITAIRRHPAI